MSDLLMNISQDKFNNEFNEKVYLYIF